MQGHLKYYTIICIISFFAAVLVSTVVWYSVPYTSFPYKHALWFFLFAVISELFVVNVSFDKRVQITPSAPIHWSAVAVLGAFPGLIVVLVSGIIGMLIRCLLFYLYMYIDEKLQISEQNYNIQKNPMFYIYGFINKVGSSWRESSFDQTIKAIILYISIIAIVIGIGGIIYSLLGGVVLIDYSGELLKKFVMPFIGLVIACVFLEQIINAFLLSATDPYANRKNMSDVLIGARVVFAETSIPLGKAQLFLGVVAMILAYLYKHIGVVGFILTTMPVVALRTFFKHWMEERSAYLSAISTLALYMQQYHPYTRGHLKRVADLCERLAKEMHLPIKSIRYISTAGFLHDIGKIGVDEEILDKTGPLNDYEWEKIKEHTIIGAGIVNHLEFLECTVDWIKYHHKWYDGGGYPVSAESNGNIPIEAYIIGVADAFDAMTDDREICMEWVCDSCGYRPENKEEKPIICPVCRAEKKRKFRMPKSLDEAMDELRRGAGSQFHPEVVKCFLTMIDRDGVHINE